MSKIDRIEASDKIIDARNRIAFLSTMFDLKNLSPVEFSEKMSAGFSGILWDIDDILEDAETALNAPPGAK